MNSHSNLLTYVLFTIIGLLLTYNTNFFSVQEIKADPVKIPNLSALNFNPKNNLSLEINLENATSSIKSDLPIASVDVEVNHPTKLVEKVVEKPIIKKEIIYETKTEYFEKLVMFPLRTPNLHVQSIELPKNVEIR